MAEFGALVDVLQDSEARIRRSLDTAVDAIITIDERGIIESANPAVSSGCSAIRPPN